jgi:hypothetical protein
VIGPVYPYRGGIAHYTTRWLSPFDRWGITVTSFLFGGNIPPGYTRAAVIKIQVNLQFK